MTSIEANGLDLEYDTFGDPADPALLLIMGLGTQMTAWRPEFCAQLAERGFHVIRFDNRDIGLSTKFEDVPVPDLTAVLTGDLSGVPYLLKDMAADAVGLLDALGIGQAHVVGASMGGMIVQELAIRHRERLLSACSIMSTTGDPAVGQPSQEALAALMQPPATDRDTAIEHGVVVLAALGSPGYPVTDEWRRRRTAENYDRSYYPAGSGRQLAAIIASGDRTEALHGVDLPTVVIHGEADGLVNVSGGKATAAAVSDARLVLLPGMGHDLPPQLWPTFVDAITANADRA
jgi:pimeloyl-ACP methyl ester carboxylesterase